MLGHSNSVVGRPQSVQMMGVSPHNLERREEERGMGEREKKDGREEGRSVCAGGENCDWMRGELWQGEG